MSITTSYSKKKVLQKHMDYAAAVISNNGVNKEEYQEYLYIKTLSMLERIDGFVGTSPWVLADFRSPRRLLVGVQDDFNRKGVLSEKGVKKKAFYVLQKFYNKKEAAEKIIMESAALKESGLMSN